MADPLAAVFEHHLRTRPLEHPRDTAEELARIARAQPDVPDIRILEPPVNECPDGCPVVQAWRTRCANAETRLDALLQEET